MEKLKEEIIALLERVQDERKLKIIIAFIRGLL